MSRDALKKVGAKRPQPPSEPTIRPVLQEIDVEEVDTKIGQWIIGNIPSTLKALAVDGKTLRGARKAGEKPPHLLSAVLHQEGLVVAQMAIGEKTNEIPKVKELLDPVPLEETVVTADALHTRKDTARSPVEEKGADYLFIGGCSVNTPRLLKPSLRIITAP